MENNKTDKPKKEKLSTDKSKKKDGKEKGTRRLRFTILRVILGVILLCCLVVGIYVIALSQEIDEITSEDLIQAQTSFVYDQMGTEVADLHGPENRTTVDMDEMPEYLIDMVIASEDERFYKHNGVEIRGVIRAAISNITGGSIQGASTITMQLVRSVVDEREILIERKIKEALLARELEKNYDKDEILNLYVNEIYVGPQTYGMQAASEYYFDKDVQDITMSEAALLVTLIRNPGYYSPYNYPDRAINIRNTVLNLLAEYNTEYADDAIAAKADELIVYEGNQDEAEYPYPWYIDYVISEASDILEDQGLETSFVYSGGLHIYTTLDVNVQKAMEEEFADDSNFPSSSTGDIVESGMTIVEPTTGQIKGIMGGRVYETKRGFNRGSDLVRSPGSTIKPVVTYGPAIDLGYGAGTVIDDAPVRFGSWSPNNDDFKYMGRITMRTAVARSRNVCAVKMLQTIGEQTGVEYGLKMGLPLVPEDANLALTLGGLTYGVSPLEMAGAFSTYANEGLFIKPYAITEIQDAKGNVIYTAEPQMTQAVSEQAAYIMTDIMTTGISSGTGTAAKIYGWQTAGKTGTNSTPPGSEDSDFSGTRGIKDAWFVGYTTALTGAIWMGYDDKKDDDGNLQYMRGVYGGTYPARLFKSIMTRALENYENRSFSNPGGVISASFDTKVGGPPTSLTPSEYISKELFIQGYGPFSDGSVKWVSVEVCKDSGKQATSFCPKTKSGIYLESTTGEVISDKVGDFKLYINSDLCNIHITHDKKNDDKKNHDKKNDDDDDDDD